MAHTDHARPRKTIGHRTEIKRVKHYLNGYKYMMWCSCGECGDTTYNRVEAGRDAEDHKTIEYRKQLYA